jgi:hypothetical protein
MLNTWHKEDIVDSLQVHGWVSPSPIESDCYFVGEAYELSKGACYLQLYFEADVGTGFQGPKSVEQVAAKTTNGENYELWLSRTRNQKWKKALARWSASI